MADSVTAPDTPAAFAEVHYFDQADGPTRLLAEARRWAGPEVHFRAWQPGEIPPPALGESQERVQLAVVLPDGREFLDDDGVDVLRQLNQGADPAALRAPVQTDRPALNPRAWVEWIKGSVDGPAGDGRGWRAPAWLLGERFGVGAWTYLRLLGAGYFLAFLSAALQLPALVGTGGLMPDTRFSAAWTWGVFAQTPTLMWLDASNTMLIGQCVAGLAVAVLLMLNIAPAVMSLLGALLFVFVINSGGVFYGRVPDQLLVEAGLLGALLAPWTWRRGRAVAPPIPALWFAWLLLFRYLSVPVLYRVYTSTEWSSLQSFPLRVLADPLPSPMGWWLAHAPGMLLELLAAVEITILVFAPLILFLGGPLRRLGSLLLVLWMLGVLVFRNTDPSLLVLFGLALLAMDDRVWSGIRARHPGFPLPMAGRIPRATLLRQMATLLMTGALFFGAMLTVGYETGRLRNPALRAIPHALKGWHVLQLYSGLSWDARLPSKRLEAVMEGTADGTNWKPYVMKHSLGPVDQAPPMLGLYLPRLPTVEMRGLHLNSQEPPWHIVQGVLKGDPDVQRFIAEDPFPDRPPVMIRLRPYAYTLASLDDWWKTGAWWQREPFQNFYHPDGLPPVVYQLDPDSPDMIEKAPRPDLEEATEASESSPSGT